MQRRLPALVALPFALNLCFNFAFPPQQFRLESNLLVSVDIIPVLATLIWALLAIYPHARWVALVNLAYLA